MSSSSGLWQWLTRTLGNSTVSGDASWPIDHEASRLVMTLIHSLWQGALLAVLLIVILRCCSARRTGLRYSLCLAALLALPACCVVTWSWLSHVDRDTAGEARAAAPDVVAPRVATSTDTKPGSKTIDAVTSPPALEGQTTPTSTISSSGAPDMAAVPEDMTREEPTPIVLRSTIDGVPYVLPQSEADVETRFLEAWAPCVAALWLAGVACMLLRLMLSLRASRQLRNAGVPVDDDLFRLVRQWADTLGIRQRIDVLTTSQLRTPAVMGFVRPVLLLPVSMLTSLTPDQLGLVLIHELAHIRRYDYAVNLIQMLIEAALFFNPALWWITRQTRIEREAYADSLAATTGNRSVEYACVLAAFAEQLALQSASSPTQQPEPNTQRATHPPRIAQALTKTDSTGDESGLVDRVRRVLAPHETPRLRVRWWSLVAIILCSFGFLVAAERGTQAVVEAVVRFLTPQERMDVLLAARDQATGTVEPETPAIALLKRELRGTVHTASGDPLPRDLQIKAVVVSGYSHSSHLIGERSPFVLRAKNGDTWLYASARGFATTVVGPIPIGTEPVVSDQELVLHPCREGTIRFEDKAGQVVPDVVVTGYYRVEGMGIQQVKSTADAAGIAIVQDVIAGPHYELAVRCPGFQMLQLTETELDPDAPLVVRLTRADPATGVILTDDGQPASGATLKLFGWASLQGEQMQFHSPPEVLTTADDQGRYSLDTLNTGRDYTVEVQTEGHGRHLVENIVPGQRDRTVQLGPEFVIEGTVIGDLDRLVLARKDIPWSPHYRREDLVGKHGLQFTLTTTFRNHGQSLGAELALITVDDGVGHFRIGNLLPGVVRLYGGGRSTVIRLVEPVQDFTFRIDDGPTRGRRVVLRFSDPTGLIQPEGTVHIHTRSGRGRDGKEGNDEVNEYEELPIVDGRIEVDSFAPGRVWYEARHVVGAWFQHGQVEIPEGDEPLIHNVDLKAAGAIHGQVYHADGRPVSTNATVSIGTLEAAPDAMRFSGTWSNTHPSNNGRYFLSPVPLGGSYYLFVHDQWLVAAVGPIHVNAAKPASEVNLVLPAGVTISGQVLDPEGRPMPNVDVRPGVSFFRHSLGMTTTPTDRDGRFAVGPINPELKSYSVTIRSRAKHQPAYVKIDDLSKPVIVRLERGIKQTGVVLDATTGQPIPGAELHAYPDGGGWPSCDAESLTDKQGCFTFSNLPAVPMKFLVRNAAWDDPGHEVVATPGKGHLEFRVKPTSRLRPR